VIREAIRKEGIVAIGKVVFTSREHNEDALKDLLRKKQEGKPIERPERREPARVINLMGALRRSVEASAAEKPAKAKAGQPTKWRQPEQAKGRRAKRAG
jgi:non-homologous end joining protein Ku